MIGVNLTVAVDGTDRYRVVASQGKTEISLLQGLGDRICQQAVVLQDRFVPSLASRSCLVILREREVYGPVVGHVHS